jgi:CMP-N,N'-diacetyllegionaminic acid synthase
MAPSPTVLATICARGGSKGVPGKNLRLLLDRPLIAYTIECARACPALSAMVVSTDDDAVARAAEGCGVEVPFRRPADLATDTAGKLPVILHAARWMEEHRGLRPDVVLDLDVTVPLRAPEDVSACVAELVRGGWDAVVTGYEPERNPYFNMVEMTEDGARPVKSPSRRIVRRQDAPRVLSVSAAVFAFRRAFLDRGDYIYDGRVGVVEVPRERAVDIDSEMDFAFTEFLMRRSRAAAER